MNPDNERAKSPAPTADNADTASGDSADAAGGGGDSPNTVDGGEPTSVGGSLLLRQADRYLGLTESVARAYAVQLQGYIRR